MRLLRPRPRSSSTDLESRIKGVLRDIGFKRSSLDRVGGIISAASNRRPARFVRAGGNTDPEIIGDLYARGRGSSDLDRFLALFKKKQREEYTRVVTPLVDTCYGTQHLIAIVVEYGSGMYDPIGR
jgi:hypothetical protein